MQIEILEYLAETHEMNKLPRLNDFKVLKRNDQLKFGESKAF